jgi:nicotinic acetylcholine receptor
MFSYFLLGSLQGQHERRLLNDLLANYDTLERPVANESEALKVRFGLSLQQIIDVVSKGFSFPIEIIYA